MSEKNKLHPSVWLHFGAGIIISLLFFLMSYHHFLLGWMLSTAITLAATVIIASLKEWSDNSFNSPTMYWKVWDWTDWWFTIFGSLVLPLIYGIIILIA